MKCPFCNKSNDRVIEEFYTKNEQLDLKKFVSIGIVKNSWREDREKSQTFMEQFERLIGSNNWEKAKIVQMFSELLSNFQHYEKNKYLDDRM